MLGIFVVKVLSILILMMFHSIYGLNPYTIELMSYNHEVRPEYYKLITLQLINNTERLVLNGSVMFRKDVTKVDLKLTLIATEKQGGKNWTLLDLKTDGCKLLGSVGQRKFSLVFIIMNNLKSFGDVFPKKCPVPKDKEYSVLNFFVDEEKFPPRFPNVILKMIVEYSEGTVRFYRGNLKIVVESKSTKKGNGKNKST